MKQAAYFWHCLECFLNGKGAVVHKEHATRRNLHKMYTVLNLETVEGL